MGKTSDTIVLFKGTVKYDEPRREILLSVLRFLFWDTLLAVCGSRKMVHSKQVPAFKDQFKPSETKGKKDFEAYFEKSQMA